MRLVCLDMAAGRADVVFPFPIKGGTCSALCWVSGWLGLAVLVSAAANGLARMRCLLPELVLPVGLRGHTFALGAKGLARMQCRPALVLDARGVSLLQSGTCSSWLRARGIAQATRTNRVKIGTRRHRGHPTLAQEGIAFGQVPLPPAQTCARGVQPAQQTQAASISFGQVHLLLPRKVPPAQTNQRPSQEQSKYRPLWERGTLRLLFLLSSPTKPSASPREQGR